MSDGLFRGRLGLEGARVPHVDRHGLLWLSRGNLRVENGTLTFTSAGGDDLAPGRYGIPYQCVSMLLLGPGSTISHDALRVLARHGTSLVAVGDGGVKFYTAPPIGQGRSEIARNHVRLWANKRSRLALARRMYAWRFGSVPPHREIEVLRGIEGARIKESYRIMAVKYGLTWHGRRYDRQAPEAADVPNQAINHAATFVEAAAEIAVAAVAAVPQLGFIHEDSSNAFTLDIADLYRTKVTLPLAFSAARQVLDRPVLTLEPTVRREAVRRFREQKLVAAMIDRVKELLDADDAGSHA